MCQVEVDGKPGVKACTTPLAEGMDIRRQNFRPFYAPALTAAVRLLPLRAGFYFRAFTQPTFVRRMFLGTLRRMAGVGRIQPVLSGKVPAPEPPLRLRSHYDVAVIGAGLSGLQAALSAAQSEKSVLLLDEYAFPGGHRLGFQRDTMLARRRDKLCEQVAASTVEQRFSATVQGGLSARSHCRGADLVGPHADAQDDPRRSNRVCHRCARHDSALSQQRHARHLRRERAPSLSRA